MQCNGVNSERCAASGSRVWTGRSPRALLAVLGLAAAVAASPVAADGGHGGGNGNNPPKPPKVSLNVRVNAPQQAMPAGNPGRNTSSIVSSKNGNQLLAGFENLQGLCGPPIGLACTPNSPSGLSAFAISTDGGATWADGGALPGVGSALTAGHPWVDRIARRDEKSLVLKHDDDDDDDGPADRKDVYLYVSRLNDATTAAGAGLGVYRGHFEHGAFVWDDVQVLTSATNPNDFYSRQALVASKRGDGKAYIVQSNILELCGFIQGGLGQIEVFRTDDFGATWQGPVVASPDTIPVKDPNDPACGTSGFLQVASAPALGPNGELYLVWQYGPELFPDGSLALTSRIAFTRSLDGGRTFSPVTFVTSLNAMRNNPPVGYAKNRMNDQARIAVAQSGRYKGRIYVTYSQSVTPVNSAVTAQSTVSSQVYVTYSDNKGATWSAPAPIAPAVSATGIKRFWPTVSVREEGGVDVVYLESLEIPTGTNCSVAVNRTARRTGPASSLVDTFLVQSGDGGQTFGAPVRVSSATSNWCNAPYVFGGFLVSNAGDYIGTQSVKKLTHATWPDDRNTFMDLFFAEIKSKDND